jgi:hypothetical protein
MPDMTPEQKLLNVIKSTQSNKGKAKKEIKVFTKVNIILIVFIAVIFLVFLIDVFTFDNKKPKYNLDLLADKVDIPETAEIALPEETSDMGVLPQSSAVISKKDIVKNLSVLGTVRGENDQVIINDKEKNKTFFLYRGDSFGDFKVEDIKEGSVTLDYKGEKIELNI